MTFWTHHVVETRNSCNIDADLTNDYNWQCKMHAFCSSCVSLIFSCSMIEVASMCARASRACVVERNRWFSSPYKNTCISIRKGPMLGDCCRLSLGVARNSNVRHDSDPQLKFSVCNLAQECELPSLWCDPNLVLPKMTPLTIRWPLRCVGDVHLTC